MEKVEAVEANLQETERVQWQRRPKTLVPGRIFCQSKWEVMDSDSTTSLS